MANRRMLWGVGVTAAAATLAVGLFPGLRFAYLGVSTHLAMETVEAVVGLGVSFLLVGRVLRGRLRRDLMLFAALLTFACVNLLLGVLPSLLRDGRGGPEMWAAIVLRLAANLMFATSPYFGDTTARAVRIRLRAIAGTVAGTTVLAGLAAVRFGGHLPPLVTPGLSPLDSSRPLLQTSHPGTLVLQALMLGLTVVAAIGYVRLVTRVRDPLIEGVTLASILHIGARLNYLLFPSLYTQWVYTGDFLRLGAWLAILVGAMREVGDYWRRLAEAAVQEERRRIARNLHDGLAQELAYIVGAAGTLRAADPQVVSHMTAAAERALDESRRAIQLLSPTPDGPLAWLLAATAEDVADRLGVQVQIAGDDLKVDPDEREALLRIVREAVTNAGRHGRAGKVTLTIDGQTRRVIVRDDGVGFDLAERAGTGVGLTSMTERAENIGGRLIVRSLPGAGTEVEIVLS